MTYEEYEKLIHTLWHCQLVFNNNGMAEKADELQSLIGDIFSNRHEKEVEYYRIKVNRIIREARDVEPEEMVLFPEV